MKCLKVSSSSWNVWVTVPIALWNLMLLCFRWEKWISWTKRVPDSVWLRCQPLRMQQSWAWALRKTLLCLLPVREQRCVKCHYTLGTQEEKTNRCKRSKRKLERNRQCCSSLNGESKHWLLVNGLSTCLLTSPNAWPGEQFFPLQYLCPVHVLLPTHAGHTAPSPTAWKCAPLACVLLISPCWPFCFFLPFSAFIVISSYSL